MKLKTIMIALAAALLIATQLMSPVAAAANTAPLLAECGTTYKVLHTDSLTSIAAKCNTTIADILARNPQIKNPNIIFDGQILNISGSNSATTTSSSTTTSILYTVVSGDTLSSIAAKFGVSVWSIKLVNSYVMSTGSVYEGEVIKIPISSSTTYSSSSKSTTSPYARVTVSDTTVSAGDSVTVYVYGFPKNASIDYRVGQSGEKYTKAYDGSTDSKGNASLTITVPSAADDGEDWVVLVTATDQVQTLDVYSPILHIDN